MACEHGKNRLEGAEAYQYELRCLRTLINRREVARLALLYCDATGELWEETVEGYRVELLVLTKISHQEAEAKYGPFEDRIKSGPKKMPRVTGQ